MVWRQACLTTERSTWRALLNGLVQDLQGNALTPDTGTTDGHLLECFLHGRDEAAFGALVRRHGPMVLGVCRRVLRHEQATYLVLVRKASAIGQRELVGN